MMLSDAEETITTAVFDKESNENVFMKTTRKLPMVFLRGDGLISIGKHDEVD